jgi:arylsulfatase A-like enzyme|tara:strand:- start:90 stop:1724 length:1635 start_codon:yes stop_codon:yes gene_type:complete
MRFKTNTLIFCFLLVGLTLLAQKQERPNVLFIIVDDLNDYVGYLNGHNQSKTPNIDNLSSSAVNFKNAHSNVPVCQPSRNSLFTGILPHRSKDFGWTPHFKQAILKGQKTFIELFKENGYSTYGTGKLLHINKREYWTEWGIHERYNYGPHASNKTKDGIDGHPSIPEPFRSINVVDGSFSSLDNTPTYIDSLGTKIEVGWRFNKKEEFKYINDNNRDLLPDEQHANWIVNKIKELESSNPSNPFFLGIGFVKPHTPLYAPKKYFDMFPLNEISLPEIKNGDIDDTHYKDVYPSTEMGLNYYEKLKISFPENEGLKKFLRAYLACVAFMDDQVGKVLNALENSLFSENTLVILTSDHGWQMGQKEYLYKNSPWEESTKIPLIIKTPQKQTGDVLEPVSLIDIYPTFVDLCNLQKTSSESDLKLDGNSLYPLLKKPNSKSWAGSDGALTLLGVGINKPINGLAVNKNKSAPWHIEILKDLDSSYIEKQNYTIRTRKYRYILYKDGSEELYNHDNDPKEWNNLSYDKNYQKLKKKLRKQLLKKLKT